MTSDNKRLQLLAYGIDAVSARTAFVSMAEFILSVHPQDVEDCLKLGMPNKFPTDPLKEWRRYLKWDVSTKQWWIASIG